VVELVGPAGAGKTSLLRILSESDAALRAGVCPTARAHLRSAVALLPTFVAVHRSARRVLWPEMKRIVYLRTLEWMLADGRADAGPVVLDEGPLYMLARLEVYGARRIGGRGYQDWRRGEVARWARRLGLVVLLDAPDDVLIERIRRRARPHHAQRLPDPQVRRFLADYRDAYDRTLTALVTAHDVRVLRFDSGRTTLREIGACVAAALGRAARPVRDGVRA
jgi:hypothetical protein